MFNHKHFSVAPTSPHTHVVSILTGIFQEDLGGSVAPWLSNAWNVWVRYFIKV